MAGGAIVFAVFKHIPVFACEGSFGAGLAQYVILFGSQLLFPLFICFHILLLGLCPCRQSTDGKQQSDNCFHHAANYCIFLQKRNGRVTGSLQVPRKLTVNLSPPFNSHPLIRTQFIHTQSFTAIHSPTIIQPRSFALIHLPTFIRPHSFAHIHSPSFICPHSFTLIHSHPFIRTQSFTAIHSPTIFRPHSFTLIQFTPIHSHTIIRTQSFTLIHSPSIFHRHSFTHNHSPT